MSHSRRTASLVLLGVVVLAGGGLPAAAASGGASISPQTLIAGKTYHLHIPLHGQSVDTVKVVGAATLKKQSTGSQTLKVVLGASKVNEKRSATLIVAFTGGSQTRYQLTVFPKPAGSQPGSGRVSKQQLQNAKKYKTLKKNWVETRVRYIRAPNGRAKQIEYQQLDPTKGAIDPKTGMPKGKWVTVPVSKQGKPEWLFQSPQGLVAYAAQQAETHRHYRQNLLLGALGLVLAGWALPYGVIAGYRRLREEASHYRGVGALGVLWWKLTGRRGSQR